MTAQQNNASDELVKDIINERKGERRWMWFRRIGIAAVVGIMLIANFVKNNDWNLGNRPRVAVVSLHGEIGEDTEAGARKVTPALEKAFKDKTVKTVVLDIDSPGGQPQEAERIYTEIEYLKKKYPKPIISVISAQGASAAYLVAIHTDKIIAGNYSMVGSIGAVIQTWNFSKVAERVGVSRNTVASGKFKDLLNPFRDMSPEDHQKVSALVGSMADHFIAEVKARRGNNANFMKIDHDIYTGEVWSGQDALALGLIDEIGTLEQVAQKYDMKVKSYGPTRSKGLFAESSIDVMASKISESLIQHLSFQGAELR